MPEVILTNVVEIVATTTQAFEILETSAQGPMGPQGPQGLSGSAVSAYIASTALSGHVAVALNAAGQALPADSTDPAHYAVAGITTGAASTGASVEVINAGVLEHLGWTFTAGQPVFLGLSGAVTQTLPPAAVFSKALGIAVSPTRISIDFQPAIFK